MNNVLKLSFSLILIHINCFAELPVTSEGDAVTMSNLEYLDNKITSALKSIMNLQGAVASTSTILSILNGGTGASTITGARTSLQVPSLTGSGASGTWNINILGNAATGTDSSKVAKTGDTMSGTLSVGASVQANIFVGDGSLLSGVVKTLVGYRASTDTISTALIDLSTITTQLNLKLTSATIPTNFVDLSTVTTQLNLKLTSATIPTNFIDLSTVTTQLNLKLTSATIPSQFVDLSTVTSRFDNVAVATTTLGNDLSYVATTYVNVTGDAMTGALNLDQYVTNTGGIVNFHGDYAAGKFGTINFDSLSNDTYYQLIADKTSLTSWALEGQRNISAIKDSVGGYHRSITVSSSSVMINSTMTVSNEALYVAGNIKSTGTVKAEGYQAQGYNGLTAVCNSGQVLGSGAYVVGIATAGACADIPNTSGNLTWAGKQVWQNKVGFGTGLFDGLSYPNDSNYGIWIQTPTIVRQMTTYDMTTPYMRFNNGGNYTGLQPYGTSPINGLQLYDYDTDQYSNTIVLKLGGNGPVVYGATGPYLGISTNTPHYALDVTGGGHFTSSMTVDGGYYGDGSNLTGVVKNLSGVRYSTDAVSTALINLSTVTSALDGKVDLTETSSVTINNLLQANGLTTAGQIYSSGTARNYFEGKINIGDSSGGTEKVYVLKADNGADSIASFLANNKSIGVGISYEAIFMTGSNATSNISLYGKGAGNVYIGGSSNSGIRMRATDTANTIYFGNQNVGITADSGRLISIGQVSAATGGLNINTTNNRVGIATTAPSEMLSVGGNVNITGAYQINGVSVAGLGNVVTTATQTFTGENTFIGATTLSGGFSSPNDTLVVVYQADATNQSIASGGFSTLTLDTEIIDRNNEFSASTWTAKETGYYHFSYCAAVTAVFGRWTVNLLVNDVIRQDVGNATGGSQDIGQCGSTILYITAGQYVNVKVYQDEGTANIINGAYPNSNSLSIHKVN